MRIAVGADANAVELKALVRKRERLIFKMFPEFDV